ncbi:MAG: hypothetical protein JSV93_03915 [Candidatus Omnitrophota bacterium]|nr:MAG: hypothetical protein JSV93_03915 [Candidatus Omnitrophota bacterium]
MEMELNNLIDKIKREGVEEAEKEAGELVSDAQGKARQIINTAESEKADIIKQAEGEIRNFRKNAEKAVKQAARDALLNLRERVNEFFVRMVKDKISGELTPEVLKEVIIKAIANFRKDGTSDIEVLVSKKDRDELQKSLFKALAKDIKLTLTGAPGIEKGFRIGEKGKDSYFDFTGEAIAESFTRYLNPKLAEMLNINLGLGKK